MNKIEGGLHAERGRERRSEHAGDDGGGVGQGRRQRAFRLRGRRHHIGSVRHRRVHRGHPSPQRRHQLGQVWRAFFPSF